MTLNDLYAAQIESIYFILLTLGACTFCLCMTAYICTTMMVEAILKQKVYDPTAAYQNGQWFYRSIVEHSHGSLPS